MLSVLPDGPDAAKWLSAEEKEWLQSQLMAERVRIQTRQRPLTLGQTLRDRRVLVLAVIYLTIVTASYGITFFLPLIIKSLGLSNVATGLVASIPYLIGTLGMMLWGYSSDRLLERKWHYVGACALAGAGLIAAGWFRSPAASIAALSVAAVGLVWRKARLLAAAFDVPQRRGGGGRPRHDQQHGKSGRISSAPTSSAGSRPTTRASEGRSGSSRAAPYSPA